MAIAADIRSLSVQDYHRMVEVGILAADERVELIEGQLYTMAAKGIAHSEARFLCMGVLKFKTIGFWMCRNDACMSFENPGQRVMDRSRGDRNNRRSPPSPFQIARFR